MIYHTSNPASPAVQFFPYGSWLRIRSKNLKEINLHLAVAPVALEHNRFWTSKKSAAAFNF